MNFAEVIVPENDLALFRNKKPEHTALIIGEDGDTIVAVTKPRVVHVPLFEPPNGEPLDFYKKLLVKEALPYEAPLDLEYEGLSCKGIVYVQDRKIGLLVLVPALYSQEGPKDGSGFTPSTDERVGGTHLPYPAKS